MNDTGFGTLKHLQTWILDSCSILWRFFCRWTTGTNKHLLADDIVRLYLQVLEGISRPLANPGKGFSNSTKTALIIADSFGKLIGDLSNSPLSNNNQIHFATILIRLRSTVVSVPKHRNGSSRRRDMSGSIIFDVLEPSVVKLCQRVETFTTLQKDLQVNTAIPN
jgi:hypothetical protein